MMNKITLKISQYATIDIYTDIPSVVHWFSNDSSKIKKTIPITEIKMEIVDKIDASTNCFLLMNGKKKFLDFDKESNIAQAVSAEETLRFPDLVYILLSMFSNILKNQNKYFIHSSVLKYNQDSSIMLIGDANSGKTSLAYQFMKNYHYPLISNDHVLVGFEDKHLVTYGGTKEMEMRGGMIKHSFPELHTYISTDESDEKLWEQKIIINDYLLKQGYQFDDYSIITDIYQISTVKGAHSFIKTKEKLDQLLYLYEQMTRVLKNNYGLITGFSYPMPSLETEENLIDLYNKISHILPSINVYIAKGSIEELPKEMVKKHVL